MLTLFCCTKCRGVCRHYWGYLDRRIIMDKGWTKGGDVCQPQGGDVYQSQGGDVYQPREVMCTSPKEGMCTSPGGDVCQPQGGDVCQPQGVTKRQHVCNLVMDLKKKGSNLIRAKRGRHYATLVWFFTFVYGWCVLVTTCLLTTTYCRGGERVLEEVREQDGRWGTGVGVELLIGQRQRQISNQTTGSPFELIVTSLCCSDPTEKVTHVRLQLVAVGLTAFVLPKGSPPPPPPPLRYNGRLTSGGLCPEVTCNSCHVSQHGSVDGVYLVQSEVFKS
ncbi:hypothetical protein Btru_046394 [Bulinus truncatus]|nr:hypothetical protein Btru_046394 [Bulinus truncatus]